MALRTDIKELLSGVEKRMRFINIARFIIDYKYKDHIKAMIPDREVLDNIIVFVLVFIKDRTLGSERNCTMSDVADFLDEISGILPEDCHIKSDELAKFIIIDVLQNSGELVNNRVYNSNKDQFEMVPLRMLEEEKGCYHLTDDAFDFLFRSKEIESDLGYSVTRFRMAEYMKRDNYAEALDQSRELVSKIRNMKVTMDDFMRRCRENITSVSIDMYEGVIMKIRALLESEYDELKSIQDNAKERARKLQEAQSTGVGTEEMKKHREALSEIIDNISLTIEEQRGLINKKMNLSEAYQMILSDSYAMNRYERMDFDTDILSVLRKNELLLPDASWFLLFPMTKPALENRFSIENLYAINNHFYEDDEDQAVEMETEEPEDMIAERNERFLRITSSIFAYISGKSSLRMSEFISSLDDEELFDFCTENALPQVILTLYSMQELSISEWKSSDHFIVTPMGEFELAWCLNEMDDALLKMKRIEIIKTEREISFTITKGNQKRDIHMTDFKIEVELEET